jgi:hypothetical protein
MGNMWQILKDKGIEKAKRNCTVVGYHKMQNKFEFQCDQIIGSKVVSLKTENM